MQILKHIKKNFIYIFVLDFKIEFKSVIGKAVLKFENQLISKPFRSVVFQFWNKNKPQCQNDVPYIIEQTRWLNRF